MVEKQSNSVNIGIKPLNGAVVSSPSPSEPASDRRVYKDSKVRQKLNLGYVPP